MTTIKALLERGIVALTQAGLETARLDTYVLLEHILGVERAILYAYPERAVTAEQEQAFLVLLARRVQREPVAYLVGHKEFYGLDFLVDRRVLIPRPETELLVEAALQAIRELLAQGRIPIVADIATGSGAIPITIAVEEPRLPILYATDISEDALAMARINCHKHGVERRVQILQGDLLEPLPTHVDILTANLPYVGTEELSVLARDVVAYEPHLALFSGPHGLDLLQRLFTQVQYSAKLNKGGVLLLEIGYAQREPLIELLHTTLPEAQYEFKKDYTGWNRLLQVVL